MLTIGNMSLFLFSYRYVHRTSTKESHCKAAWILCMKTDWILSYFLLMLSFLLFFLKKETNSLTPRSSSTNWSESLSTVKAVDLLFFFRSWKHEQSCLAGMDSFYNVAVKQLIQAEVNRTWGSMRQNCFELSVSQVVLACLIRCGNLCWWKDWCLAGLLVSGAEDFQFPWWVASKG